MDIQASATCVTVLVADDHEVVRRGIESVLAGTNIQVVAEASCGDDAIRLTKMLRPDVVLLDIRMPGFDGLKVLDTLRREVPDMKVVMLSTSDNPTYVARAVALGADDYVFKGCGREELIATIETAAAGQSPVEHGALNRVATTLQTRKLPSDDIPVTSRETQVLRHVAFGLNNREIGQSLGISTETVKEHVQKIFRKIAVNDRTQAAVWAVRKGMVG